LPVYLHGPPLAWQIWFTRFILNIARRFGSEAVVERLLLHFPASCPPAAGSSAALCGAGRTSEARAGCTALVGTCGAHRSRRPAGRTERLRARVLEPIARTGLHWSKPAPASPRTNVSSVSGDGSGADQRGNASARCTGRRERDVRDTARHSNTRCDGGDDGAGWRRTGADGRQVSGGNVVDDQSLPGESGRSSSIAGGSCV
jgi:hypothetical protein